MKFPHGRFLLWILTIVWAPFANATAKVGSNSTTNANSTRVEPGGTTPSPTHPFIHLKADAPPPPTTSVNSRDGEDFSTNVNPPTTDVDRKTLGTAPPPPGDAITRDINAIKDDSLEFINRTTNRSEAFAVATEALPATTVQPVQMAEDCLCDLTPNFCDIGCCCDTADCDVANLSTLFTGCPQKAISGVCVEKWLMFKANVDPAFVTVTHSFLCIDRKDDAPQFLPAPTWLPRIGNSCHFSTPAAMSSTYTRHFYRVNDVIQTYFSNSYARGLLRQPSPGAVATFCTNQNPAKFLRSVSFSCTRAVTHQSCTTDPNLNAQTYFYNMSLVKVPVVELMQMPDFLIAVAPQSDWPGPSEHNSSCLNVVKKVEFTIGYTGRGELTYANVNIILADVDLDLLLFQTHSVQFQLEADAPPPPQPVFAEGLRIGSPLLTLLDGKVLPLTTQGLSQSGECSSDPSRRTPILFTFNTFTGCQLRLPSDDCSALRSQIYTIFAGIKPPDVMAMNFGSQPEWTKIITQRCSVSMEETCETGCVLPKALSIRVLWARQGPLDLSQNYILGAKYIFQCQTFQCPVLTPLILTTEVIFAETTRYPEPPRGTPQPGWKFPLSFFSRGLTELDGHFILNGSEKVTWSLILSAVMLLTGLEFFM